MLLYLLGVYCSTEERRAFSRVRYLGRKWSVQDVVSEGAMVPTLKSSTAVDGRCGFICIWIGRLMAWWASVGYIIIV